MNTKLAVRLIFSAIDMKLCAAYTAAGTAFALRQKTYA